MSTFTLEDLEKAMEEDDGLDGLCAKSNPSDFYFEIGVSPYSGWSTIYATPKVYFDTNGYMYDQHLMIEHLLPAGSGCEAECVWEIEMGLDELNEFMLNTGFLKNEKFSKMCR